MNTLKLINITDQYHASDGVYHLAHYHPPKSGEQDQISRYLLDFEDGAEPQTTQWIRLAALLVSQSLSFDIIVRPVSANEFNAKKPSSLEKLCIAIARKSGAKYQRTRLQKATTANLNSFGLTSDELRECPDSYSFDEEYGTTVTRVLVVDDFVVNSATLTAITSAIHGKLPRTKVFFFALGRIEEHESNSHLDVRYFTSTTSPMRAEFRPAGAPRSVRRGAPPSKGASLKPALRPIRPRAQTAVRPAGDPQQQPGRRPGVWATILTTVFAVALLAGGYVLFANRLPANENNFFQVPGTTVSEVVPTTQDLVRPATGGTGVTLPRLEPAGPQGVIVVPSVGLRAEHFVDSKVLKVSVRNGDKVTIVKKVSSSTGPRWLQIRTNQGKVGWVWASVVRQIKSRAVAMK